MESTNNNSKEVNVDVLEQRIFGEIPELLKPMLIDRTTDRNIVWATGDYQYLGTGYNSCCEIKEKQLLGKNFNLIKSRILKSKELQESRTKEKAEVLTPPWICNSQNNLVDKMWFNKENVFNTEKNESWETNIGKIRFPGNENKTWINYVDERRMEISCGEAPYLTSRYNVTTGEFIEYKNRIGLLDRKLRIVNENTADKNEWFKWTYRAYKSIYGFEFQGDSLFLARENLLMTFIDHVANKFKRMATVQELMEVAEIISWNLWQMDGLTYTVPFSGKKEAFEQISFFREDKETINATIKDWSKKEVIEFISLMEEKY